MSIAEQLNSLRGLADEAGRFQEEQKARIAELEAEMRDLGTDFDSEHAMRKQAEAESRTRLDAQLTERHGREQAEAELDALTEFIEFCAVKGMRPTKQARVIFDEWRMREAV